MEHDKEEARGATDDDTEGIARSTVWRCTDSRTARRSHGLTYSSSWQWKLGRGLSISITTNTPPLSGIMITSTWFRLAGDGGPSISHAERKILRLTSRGNSLMKYRIYYGNPPEPGRDRHTNPRPQEKIGAMFDYLRHSVRSLGNSLSVNNGPYPLCDK